MLIFILGPALLFFIGLIIYVSVMTSKEIAGIADETLFAHGEQLSSHLEVDLGQALSTVKILSQSVQGQIERDIVPDREVTNVLLQEALANNDMIMSTWMFWEENAFDGKDEKFVNVKGHDSTGRYIPMWSQTESGEFFVEPVEGYDKEGDIQRNLNSVLENGKPEVWEPFRYETDGKEVLITSIVYPIIVNNETVGITGVNLLLDEVSELIRDFSFYETGFAGLMTSNGMVIGHHNEELVGKNYFETPAMADKENRDKTITAIANKEQIMMSGYSGIMKKEVYGIFTPLELEGIEYPWVTFITVPATEVMVVADRLKIAIYIAAAVIIAALVAIILVATRSIVRPIEAVVENGHKMARGDFSSDMSEKFLHRKDELGDLARIFETVTGNMRQLIGHIQMNAQELLRSADTVNASSNKSSSAANQVANAIEEVAESAETQMQAAVESAKSMEEMTGGVQRVADAATTVSESVSEMTERANAGKRSVKKVTEQMDRIQMETTETKTVIEQLGEGTSKIGNIVSTITDISEQTNLLALNAAIEAARAGESGQGFAVVADEVRILADETNVSAHNIQQLIQAIQVNTVQATKAMETNVQEVNMGISQIAELGQAFEKITSSVELVVTEIEELAAIAEQMSAATEEIAAASEEIAASAENSTGQTEYVASAAKEQLSSMKEMQKISERLKHLANDLNINMNQFNI